MHRAVRGLAGAHEQSSLSKPQCAQFVLYVVSIMSLHDLVYMGFALHMDLYCLQVKFFDICHPMFFFFFFPEQNLYLLTFSCGEPAESKFI